MAEQSNDRCIHEGSSPVARDNHRLSEARERDYSRPVACLLQGRPSIHGATACNQVGIETDARSNLTPEETVNGEHSHVIKSPPQKIEREKSILVRASQAG